MKLPSDLDCRGKWGRRCDALYLWLPVAIVTVAEVVFWTYREWIIWTQ